MGEPRKKRKQYETPRKQWDKRLLEAERKLANTYGLVNKREIRRPMTWLKYKRNQAKSLLALTMDKRMQRQQELISGLTKIGMISGESTLDDVLGLKIEGILEKRLQTMVFRKGLANSVKQARQFITHGHIAINGKRVSSPGYIVPVSEAQAIGWYRKPIKIENEKPAKDLKKEFEEAAGAALASEGAVAESAEGKPESAEPAQNDKEGAP
ncbi:MAG TPA: 30S ribosomal protein S4 [archaeon]|nr:30S ribosomal protein S4 [archaeon]